MIDLNQTRESTNTAFVHYPPKRVRPRLSAEQRKDRPHIVILGTGMCSGSFCAHNRIEIVFE